MPRRFTLDGRRSAGTSGRSTQRPVLSVASVTSSFSVVPSTDIDLTVEERRPRRCRARSSAAAAPTSPAAARRAPSRRRDRVRPRAGKAARASKLRRSTRCRSDRRAARRAGAVTLPAIRPEPSGAMRPLTLRVGAREIDDVEGLDEQRRAVRQDARADPAIAAADCPSVTPRASRMKPTSMFCVASKTLETRRQLVEIEVLDRDLRFELRRVRPLRRRIANIARQHRVAGLDPQTVERHDRAIRKRRRTTPRRAGHREPAGMANED